MKPFYFQALKYLHELRNSVINGESNLTITELQKLENAIISNMEKTEIYTEISKDLLPEFLDEFVNFMHQAGLKKNSRKEALKFVKSYHTNSLSDLPKNSLDSDHKQMISTKHDVSNLTNTTPSSSYATANDPLIITSNIVTDKIEDKNIPQSNSDKENLTKVVSPQKSPVGEGISNFFNQLWNNFREELTINWFLFLGAFMIFGSGLFYCFTGWSEFGKNYQFIAITGGGAFIFLFEVLLSRGMKLKKSPRLFALIFILFLPIILQVHFKTGLIYYLIGLSLGIPALISLKNRYFTKLNNNWLASIAFLLLIPPTTYLASIDSESIITLILLSEALLLIGIQYLWQPSDSSKESHLLPSVITCWFYFCLNFSIFSISALIFTVYTIFVQFLLLSKNRSTKGGFVYGSFIATIFFCALNENLNIIYCSIGLLMLCLHRMNVDGHKIRIPITLSISIIWILFVPSLIWGKFSIICNLIGEVLALIYFCYFANKWDYKFSNRLLLVYGLVSLPAFIQSSAFLCLHWVLVLVGTHYRNGTNTDEDRLIRGLFLSAALIPALNWCDCRLGLISALWIAVCIFGKSRLKSIKPYTILASGFLITSTIHLAFANTQYVLQGNIPEFYLHVAFHAFMAWLILFILPTRVAFIICLTLWQLPIIVIAKYLTLQTTNFSFNFYWLTCFGLALLILHPYLLQRLKIIPLDQIDDARLIVQRVQQGLCLLLLLLARLILKEPSAGLIFLTLFASYRFPLMVWALLSFNVLNFVNINAITSSASIKLFPHILLVVFHLLIVELKLFKGSLKFLQKWHRLFTLINLGILLTLSLLNLNMLLPNRIYLYIFTLLVSLIISLRWGLFLGICILPLAQLGLQLYFHDHSVFWNTFILLAGVQYLVLNHLFFKDNLKSVCNLDSSFFGINQLLLLSLFFQMIVFKTIGLSTLYLCLIPLISYFFLSPAKSTFYIYSLMLLIVHYTTVQFDWWGVIIVGLPLIARKWHLQGYFCIWKTSLFILVISTLIYVFNSSPIGIIISLTCLAGYMLIEAYLEQRKVFVYSAFISIGLIFVTAKIHGVIGSLGFSNYVLLALSICFYLIAPKLMGKWGVFSQPMLILSRILPVITVIIEANGSDSPLIYLISGIFYQFIQDDSKLSYYRLGSLMAFNLAIYSLVEPTDLAFQIIPVCVGFSILWYAHSLDEAVDKDILKIVKFFGNICFYSGALFDFVSQVSIKYLLFCWLVCALGGWLALILRAKLQLLFAASVFVLTLMGFVIKQLILEVSTGIPLIAGIGFLLVVIAIFLEKFKDAWSRISTELSAKFVDWND